MSTVIDDSSTGCNPGVATGRNINNNSVKSAMMGTDGDSNDSEVIGVDRELWLEWLKVISDWPTNSKSNSKNNEHIRDMVRKGVPTNLRAKIWKLLANAQQVTPSTSEQYKEMLKKTSYFEKQIQRDIARTYPEIDYFKDESGPGQEGLFNVIKAYSLYDDEVGYCQGSAFIVGLLLLQLSEEESFLLLCKIMEDYRMREIYKPTMAELGLCIYQLECLVQEQLPELYVHFQSQNFYTSLYSSSWFCTLFTTNLPLSLAYRVMDLFLSEGLEIIFRLSLAILQICKEDLLKLDMEGLIKYFQKEMPSRIESECLINVACQLIKYDSKKMKKLCKDYTTIKVKEQEEAIEFRRLRTENRLLQDRLKMLEEESKELAGKLIKGQVCLAEEAEDKCVIKRELSQMRLSDKEHRATIGRMDLRIAELEKLLADRNINYSNEASMLIQALQEELVAVKLREAENHVEIEQLNKKITEQELYIKSLRENVPEDPIAQLQEELSAVKLREAEANFAMKELRTKFNELQTLWFEHLQQVHGINSSNSQPNSLDQNSPGSSPPTSGPPTSTSAGGGQQANSLNTQHQNNQVPQPSSLTSSLASSNPISKFFNSSVIKRASSSSNPNSGQSAGNSGDEQSEIHRIKQEMLTLKLHEADSLAEVKMLQSREMELETQIKIQDNKFKRKEDEFKRMELELLGEKTKLIEISNQLKEEQRKLTDLEWQRKEEQMMRRMKDVEHTRLTGELKQKISSLEIKIEEINTAKKLAESGIEPKDASEYQERVAELQSESFRLDASNRKLHDMERKNSEREKESDKDDLKDAEESEVVR